MDTLRYTFKLDNRFGVAQISSRIGLRDDANIFDTDLQLFDDIVERSMDNTACVLIDEAQFLNKQQVRDVCRVADELNIPVLTYGLRSDFLGEPFEGSLYLLIWADELIEIKTICHCGRKATMNARLDSDRNILRHGEQIDIGGKEKYVSLCRKHYNAGNIGPIF
jgi:thymidine kinase